jgi:hypothetical protein
VKVCTVLDRVYRLEKTQLKRHASLRLSGVLRTLERPIRSSILDSSRDLAGENVRANAKLQRGLNANVTYFTTPEVVIFPSVGEEFGSFWSCSGVESVHRR